jgi:transposase
VRAGRKPEALAKELELSAATIWNWLKQADLDNGGRNDGLTTDEKDELRRLRRENRQLREEREIQETPRPGLRERADRSRPWVPIRESQTGRAPGGHDVSSAGDLHQRLLRMGQARAEQAGARGRGAEDED